MANDKVDSKEGILASDQLNLKVLGQDGQVVQFKIKKNTPDPDKNTNSRSAVSLISLRPYLYYVRYHLL